MPDACPDNIATAVQPRQVPTRIEQLPGQQLDESFPQASDLLITITYLKQLPVEQLQLSKRSCRPLLQVLCVQFCQALPCQSIRMLSSRSQALKAIFFSASKPWPWPLQQVHLQLSPWRPATCSRFRTQGYRGAQHRECEAARQASVSRSRAVRVLTSCPRPTLVACLRPIVFSSVTTPDTRQKPSRFPALGVHHFNRAQV